MVTRLLRAIKQNLMYVIVVSLALGLVAGQYFGPDAKGVLKALVLPVLFLMIYPMMINIKLEGLFAALTDVRIVGLSLLINFVLSPLLAVGITSVFFAGDPVMAVGIYLIALVPTSGMTAAWTGLADGDLNSALIAMAVNLILAVFLLPIYLDVLLDASVTFYPMKLFKQLVKVVFVPMIAGNLTRQLIVRRYGEAGFKRLKPNLGGLSSLGVMFIVFIAMSLRSQAILSDVVASATVVIPLLLYYAVILAVGSGVGALALPRPKATALVYATSMRNLSIAVAIAMLTYPEAVLPIALGYMIQPPLGAAYMHYRRDYDSLRSFVLRRPAETH